MAPVEPRSIAPPEQVAPIGLDLIVLWILFGIVLGTTALGLRLWSRKIKRAQLKFNDWSAIVAYVFIQILGGGMTHLVLSDGLGGHIWQLQDPLQQITDTVKWLAALQIVWGIANTGVRLSVLDFYISIFRMQQFRRIAHAFMAITVLFLVGVILQVFLMCTPFEANWDPKLPGAHCGDTFAQSLSIGVINLCLDFAIVCLPMPLVWNLQLPRHKKISLVFIFGIGFITCVLSGLRLQALSTIEGADQTYERGHIAWWTLLEPALGLVNCCLPILQPVLSKAASSKLLSLSWVTTRGSSYAKGSMRSWPASRSGQVSANDRKPSQTESQHAKEEWQYLTHEKVYECSATPSRGVSMEANYEMWAAPGYHGRF